MNKLLRKLSLGVVCLLMTAFICSCQSAQTGGTFEVGKNTFLLNGKPFVVKAAEVHYPRIPEPYWEQRILSCKALGMNTLVCMCSGTCMNSSRISLIFRK